MGAGSHVGWRIPVTYCPSMLLLALALLSFAPFAQAAPGAAPATTSAPATTPVPPATPAPAATQAAPAAASTSAEAKNAAGVSVSADLRPSYLAGFPVLVNVTVTNTTATVQTFPNLAARTHLVHFTTVGPKGKSERHTTPPDVEPTATWTIPPGSSQRVLLEVPSSAAWAAGVYRIQISVVDPAGTVALPERKAVLAAATPVAGSPVWEPAIATNVGTMFPWLNQSATGFDLFLMSFDGKAPKRVVAQYALTSLASRVEPILARSRPTDAQSRPVYWLSNDNTLSVGLLEVTRLDGPVRSYSLPYPKVELLDRGAVDAQGGLVVPVWIPNPTGTGGTLRAWCVSARGQQLARQVAVYPRKPTLTATAVDAGSGLVLAVSTGDGIDLYRIDATTAAELPPAARRVWKPESGWTPRRLAFDVLPDSGNKPGGLSMLSVFTRVSDGVATHRALFTDLSGDVLADSGERPWPFPGEIVDLLPNGYGPFYVLTRSGADLTYGAQGGVTSTLKGAGGTLWAYGEEVYLRTFGGAGVVRDTTVGPRQQ